MGDTEPIEGSDVARTALRTRAHVIELQASLDALEQLAVPVVACIHGACYGAGLDMICACDVRWACDGTRFSIKEVDVGLCADVGVLARLPRIIGNSSLVHELAYSARPLSLAVRNDSVRASRQVTSASAASELLVTPSILAVGPAFCELVEGVKGSTQTVVKVALHSVDTAL